MIQLCYPEALCTRLIIKYEHDQLSRDAFGIINHWLKSRKHEFQWFWWFYPRMFVGKHPHFLIGEPPYRQTAIPVFDGQQLKFSHGLWAPR